MKRFVVFAVLLFGSLAFAGTSNAPVLPDKNRADILAVQKREADDQSKMANLRVQYMQLQSQYSDADKDYQQAKLDESKALADGCAAASADCDKDWTLNPGTLKFDAKPKQPKSK